MMNRNEAVEMLKNGVRTLATSEKFLKFLEFKLTLRHYSLHNTLMVLFQKPDATVVGGMKNFWNKNGRWVRKGEKALAIWAPLFGKREVEHPGGMREEMTFLRGFKTVPVFDLSQTEGKPLPERPMPTLLGGNDDKGIYALLAAHVTQSGLELRREEDQEIPKANGSYSWIEKVIRVRPDLSAVQALKTLAHEVAHWKLHSDDEGKALSREVQETEAEAAAFLALAHFGIRADEYSFAYVAGWANGNLSLIEKSLSRIEKAADAIIEAVESRLEQKKAA